MANEASKPYKPYFSCGPDQLQIEHAIVLDELSDAYLEIRPCSLQRTLRAGHTEALARDPDPEADQLPHGVTVSKVKNHLLWPIVEAELRRELEGSDAAPSPRADPIDLPVHLRGVRDGCLIGGPGEGRGVDGRALGAMVSDSP